MASLEKPSIGRTFWSMATFASSRAREGENRVVHVTTGDANVGYHHKGNAISTGKYNLATFFPKGLYEQFRRVANLYFLSVAIISLFDAISPIKPYTIWSPLCLVVGLSMAKEAVEDYQRHKQDHEQNTSLTERFDGVSMTQCEWRDVKAGDIIRVVRDQSFPCDLVLLASPLDDSVCYVETKNLDGETNLKLKRGVEGCGACGEHGEKGLRALRSLAGVDARGSMLQDGGDTVDTVDAVDAVDSASRENRGDRSSSESFSGRARDGSRSRSRSRPSCARLRAFSAQDATRSRAPHRRASSASSRYAVISTPSETVRLPAASVTSSRPPVKGGGAPTRGVFSVFSVFASAFGSRYTARRQSSPPAPPMNENRERAHPLSETSAVALSSQNVSRVASVGRKRACSRAVEETSASRDETVPGAFSPAAAFTKTFFWPPAAAPGATTLQKSVSAPPGVFASARGSRIHSSFVGRDSSFSFFSFASSSRFARARDSFGPKSSRVASAPIFKDFKDSARYREANALKLAYMRAPCGSEHTLSGWNCTPKCGRVTCSRAMISPPARALAMSPSVTHRLTNKPSSDGPSDSGPRASLASVHAVARSTPAPSRASDAASTARLW